MTNDQNSEEATRLVKCRECESSFMRKSMSGHLGKGHPGLNKSQYIQKYGLEAREDFWDKRPTAAQRQSNGTFMQEINQRRKRESTFGSIDILTEDNYNNLTEAEQKFYDEYVEQLAQQVDREETQMPIISGLAFNLIRRERLTKTALAGKGYPDKEIETAIKQIEERNEKAMKELAVSRSDALKRGAAIKSTPAMLISGYIDEIERMSPEMLDAMRLEESRVCAKMQERIERFLLSNAPDLPKEDESDEQHSAEQPLSLEQVLARAGIQVGGSAAATSTPVDDLPF